MANVYVRSTDGSNADNGSTWALAKADLAGAAAIDVAGDTIYVSQAHSESTAGNVTYAFAGTTASPVKIIVGDDSAEPPTTVSTATVATTGSSTIAISGEVYVVGLSFLAADAGNLGNISLGSSSHVQYYENCTFHIRGSSPSGNIQATSAAGATTPSKVVWRNCHVRFAASAHGIKVSRGHFAWEGGSLVSGGSGVTALFLNGGSSGNFSSNFLVSGVDLSNNSSTMNLMTAGECGRQIFRNCKLPLSWAGVLCSGTIVAGQRVEMHNCDSGDTNYRLWIEDRAGSIKSETTLVKTGGASDGTTSLSFKVTTNSSAEYPSIFCDTPEFSVWNNTTGSSVTVTVDILHDSATNLKDDEVWLDLQYLGTSGYPLGTWISDAKATVLSTAADQAASSATWTTTGMGNPNTQKLSVTFTPQEKGFIQARVCVAKASYTLYVDPVLQVS